MNMAIGYIHRSLPLVILKETEIIKKEEFL